MGNFDGMHQNVLAVTRTVFQTAEELDQFGMEAVDPRLERRLFAGVFNDLVDFLRRLFDGLLDPRRMDTAVLDQFFKGDARDLAADRIESGEDDGFRRPSCLKEW